MPNYKEHPVHIVLSGYLSIREVGIAKEKERERERRLVSSKREREREREKREEG